MPLFRRTVRVPADNGTPNDLPPWAKEELVSRRLQADDWMQKYMEAKTQAIRTLRENKALREELAAARNG